MSWVRLEDTFPEHPKIDKVGGDAAWLHVCALAYCNRNETDGRIPAGCIHRLSDRKKPSALAARLVDAGLWEADDDGWRIHDYLHYQPSRAQREKVREDARERMKKARSSKDVHANTSRSSPNPDPTRPDPLVPISDRTDSVTTPAPSSEHLRIATLWAEELVKTAVVKTTRDRWVKGTAANKVAENGPQIEDVLRAGVDDETAVSVLIGEIVLPKKHAWYANPHCEECPGDGWASSTAGAIPCECRRPEPYMATVHQLRGESA